MPLNFDKNKIFGSSTSLFINWNSINESNV